MKIQRLSALILALSLQVFPMCRAVFTHPAINQNLAIIFRWSAGATAALGAYDAVSGATNVYFTNPTNATGQVGVPFNFLITITNYGADSGATFAAIPLPPGLTVSTVDHATSKPSDVHGIISGTPLTVTNKMLVHLGANYPGLPGVTTNLFLTILPAVSGPPGITNQPLAQTVMAGATVNFNVGVTGAPTLSFQWRFFGTNLPGGTTNSMTISSVRTNRAGDYSVVITNSAGAITSTVAHLTVNVPPNPLISTPQPQGAQFRFSFNPVVGLTNTVMASGSLDNTGWSVLTNIPPPTSPASLTITDVLSSTSRFYRVQFSP